MMAKIKIYIICDLHKQNITIMNEISSLVHPQQKLCRIKSKKSDKYLSISTDPQTKGVAILAQKSDKLQNRFIITKYTLVYSFQSLINNQYLSIAYGSNQPGAMLVTLSDFGDASQRFLLKSVGIQNQYMIESFCGLVLDCYEEGTQKGTRIIQWQQSGKPHQIWNLQFL